MSNLQRRRGKPDPSAQASAYVAKMCSSFPRLRADASSLSQLTASLAATLDSSASSSSSSSSPLRLCTATACPTCLWRAPPAGVVVCASCYGPLPSASLSAFAVLGDDDGVTAHVAAHVLCSPACVADFDPSTPVAIATDKSEPALAAAAAVAGAAGRTGNDGGGKPTTPQFLWHGCLALAYIALVHTLYHAGAIAPTALLDPLSWCVALGLLSSLVSLANDISPLLDPHSLDSQHPPRQAPRAPSALASATAGIRAVAGPMQLASGVCALVLWAGARAEMESFAPDPALLVRIGAAQGTGSAAAAAAAAAASSSSLITDGGGVVTAGGGILLWLMITLLPIVDAVVAAVFFPPFSSPSGVSMPKSSAATAATAPAPSVSAGVSGPDDCAASPLGVSGPSARAAAAASPAALSITALAVNLGTGLAPNAAAAAALGNGWGAVSLVAVGAGAVVGCDWARAWLEKAAVWGEERRRRGEKKAGWGG